MISTKDLLEDVFADIADHEERDKKSSTPMMPETVFFYNTMSERLGNVPFLQIQAGDFTSAAARKFSAGRGETFGEKFKIKNAVTEKMKECCKHRFLPALSTFKLLLLPPKKDVFLYKVVPWLAGPGNLLDMSGRYLP